MLAEKFFLYLEALIESPKVLAESRKAHADGSPRVVSASPHVLIRLPAAKEDSAKAQGTVNIATNDLML